MDNDPTDQVSSYVLQSITEPPHKYVRVRHYPLPSFFFHGRDPAYRVAVAQTSENVQTAGYFDLSRVSLLRAHPDDVPF